MINKNDRFYVPTGPTIIETYRAFRTVMERMAASRGEALDPACYRDSPGDRPELYSDQPQLLEPEP